MIIVSNYINSAHMLASGENPHVDYIFGQQYLADKALLGLPSIFIIYAKFLHTVAKLLPHISRIMSSDRPPTEIFGI
jgi:hypothetical protein